MSPVKSCHIESAKPRRFARPALALGIVALGVGISLHLHANHLSHWWLPLVALVVAPKQAAPGRPWIWRAEFFDTELESLRKTEADTPVALDFCINGICEENEFRAEARDMGNVLVKDISIDRNQEKIKSMRVMLPKESMKYEYQGDVGGILKKICQAAPSPTTGRRSSPPAVPRTLRDILR